MLFSAPMVRAILDGRKTQTRRVVKSIDLRGGIKGVRVAPNTFCYLDYKVPGLGWCPAGGSPVVPLPQDRVEAASPYGKPGDRLWVREAFHNCPHCGAGAVAYRAGGWIRRPRIDGPERDDNDDRPLLRKCAAHGWSPSIHMPRWASRITLEVTGVRVERLQDITEFEAIAEGVELEAGHRWRDYMPEREAPTQTHSSARESFFSLWESINGTESLAANPWVWVVSFRGVAP